MEYMEILGPNENNETGAYSIEIYVQGRLSSVDLPLNSTIGDLSRRVAVRRGRPVRLNFKQDNAQPNMACVPMDCHQSYRTLQWSATSPDLLPIGHILSVMRRRLQPTRLLTI
ncbi:EPC2 [Cordylochernes scorpioides]|uniref:EPC2 n=1 Tax=Cordylochernes scorpioides TaxID=51811 RepID=A0ABY6KYE8_9ARAC|nr:EPC2 [Cordylochernes scorpioides]